jgi:hypothetical protein
MERLRVVIGESLVASFGCIKGGGNFNNIGKKDKKSQKIRGLTEILKMLRMVMEIVMIL